MVLGPWLKFIKPIDQQNPNKLKTLFGAHAEKLSQPKQTCTDGKLQ